MISEQELRRVAGRVGMGVGQAEHEYVILCVLDVLSRTPPLSETFCLKGGTALRYVYFADWRHSVDLDFSVLPAFPAERLRSGLREWFERVEELHGVQVSLRDFHKANGAARARARFVGPLRHPNRLLLDVTLDEPVLLPPQRRPVVGDLFGDQRRKLPGYLQGLVKRGPGHRSRSNERYLEPFLEWLDGLGLAPNRLYGRPQGRSFRKWLPGAGTVDNRGKQVRSEGQAENGCQEDRTLPCTGCSDEAMSSRR